ncbi:MAG: hypothetical protein ACSHWU_10240, partial [Marinicella sp.]
SILYLSLYSLPAQAVYLNQNGLGEVMLVPYYTVNNNLNTLVNVTNTTNDGKAIKINIREGLNGLAVLSYNVYLAPHDSWVFALMPTLSTIPNYSGQNSALHIAPDNSCAPFLNKSGQEFLPYEFSDVNNDLSRSREGFIEVIEMGVINPNSNLFRDIEPGGDGIPFSCEAVMNAWSNGGDWTGADLTAAQGGLSVETSLIDVAEGINYSYPSIVMSDFFGSPGWDHANPGDTSLSLDKADPAATKVNGDEVRRLTFERGIDAVSALLMSPSISGNYDLSSFVYGQTEMVYTFPTRRFYFNNGRLDPPFQLKAPGDNYCYDRYYGGNDFYLEIYDRESQKDDDSYGGGIVQPPQSPLPELCGTTAVLIYKLVYDSNAESEITQSLNSKTISSVSVQHATENGFTELTFFNTRALLATDQISHQSVALNGLPVVGVKLQRFTNAGAAQGLLAQYGAAELLRTQPAIITEQ